MLHLQLKRARRLFNRGGKRRRRQVNSVRATQGTTLLIRRVFARLSSQARSPTHREVFGESHEVNATLLRRHVLLARE